MKSELPAEFAKVEKRYGKALRGLDETEHERFATRDRALPDDRQGPDPRASAGLHRRCGSGCTRSTRRSRRSGSRSDRRHKALLDRYFGKEPLDFTPPQRLRRGLPDPATSPLSAPSWTRPPTCCSAAQTCCAQIRSAARRIAGNMKWLEQQVLPVRRRARPGRWPTAVNDLFDAVRGGEGRRLDLHRRRAPPAARAGATARTAPRASWRRWTTALRAQPDRGILDEARDVMDDLDDAESLEDVDASAQGPEGRQPGVGQPDEARRRAPAAAGAPGRETWSGPSTGAARSPRPTSATRPSGPARDLRADDRHLHRGLRGGALAPRGWPTLKRLARSARDNIIPTRLRELGLLDEGTGEGAYVPHYSIFDKLSRTLRGPVRLPAAGRNRKILSIEVQEGRETFGKGTNKLDPLRDGRAPGRSARPALRLHATGSASWRPRSSASSSTTSASRSRSDRDRQTPRIPEGWYVINGTRRRRSRAAEGAGDDVADGDR